MAFQSASLPVDLTVSWLVQLRVEQMAYQLVDAMDAMLAVEMVGKMDSLTVDVRVTSMAE